MSAVYLIAAFALSSIDAPSVEAENIFAILDEPAETPLTPNQLEAEALADLQAIALECDMAIRQHIANDGHLTDKANKDVRLIRAEARRIVAGFNGTYKVVLDGNGKRSEPMAA